MFKTVNSILQEKTKLLEKKEYFAFTFFKAPVAHPFKEVLHDY